MGKTIDNIVSKIPRPIKDVLKVGVPLTLLAFGGYKANGQDSYTPIMTFNDFNAVVVDVKERPIWVYKAISPHNSTVGKDYEYFIDEITLEDFSGGRSNFLYCGTEDFNVLDTVDVDVAVHKGALEKWSDQEVVARFMQERTGGGSAAAPKNSKEYLGVITDINSIKSAAKYELSGKQD